MKFIKCVLWFVKEYANVGIAVALFLLIALQIEKQYRTSINFENCIDQDWTFHYQIDNQGIDLKTNKVTDRESLEKIVALCTHVRSKALVAFNYFKGKTHRYIDEYPF